MVRISWLIFCLLLGQTVGSIASQSQTLHEDSGDGSDLKSASEADGSDFKSASEAVSAQQVVKEGAAKRNVQNNGAMDLRSEARSSKRRLQPVNANFAKYVESREASSASELTEEQGKSNSENSGVSSPESLTRVSIGIAKRDMQRLESISKEGVADDKSSSKDITSESSNRTTSI